MDVTENSELNELEKELRFVDSIRARCGLARTHWLKILGVENERLMTWDGKVRPHVMRRALNVQALYEQYKTDVEGRLVDETERAAYVLDDKPYLSSIQVARVLGCGDFHIVTLRQRGKINATLTKRYWAYAPDDVRALLDFDDSKGYHSSIAGTFVRYLSENLTTPEGAVA